MTNNNHPITPPPELVEQWRTAPEYTTGKEMFTMVSVSTRRLQEVATQAARWGSDQELDACCSWVSQFDYDDYSYGDSLRAARRSPKPPSLKEQAKFAAAVLRSPDETCSIAQLQQHWHTICNALEQLND